MGWMNCYVTEKDGPVTRMLADKDADAAAYVNDRSRWSSFCRRCESEGQGPLNAPRHSTVSQLLMDHVHRLSGDI